MNQKFFLPTEFSLFEQPFLRDYQRSPLTSNCDEHRVCLNDFLVSLSLVNSSTQREQVYQLREAVYQDKMSYLLNSEADLPTSADKLDQFSYIFYCRHGDRIIASCRYTPAINGTWENSAITEMADLVPADKAKMLQVGRLLISPEYRSQLIAEMILWASCDWLLCNTNFNSFYAICTPALVRFYRHFGVKSIPKATLTLPKRQNKTYRIVYGLMPNIVETLEKYLIGKDSLLAYPSQQMNTDNNYPLRSVS